MGGQDRGVRCVTLTQTETRQTCKTKLNKIIKQMNVQMRGQYLGIKI